MPLINEFISFLLRSEAFPEKNSRFFHAFCAWIDDGYYYKRENLYCATKSYCKDTLWQLEGVISILLKLEKVLKEEVNLELELYFQNKDIKDKAESYLELYQLNNYIFKDNLSFDTQKHKDFYFVLKANNKDLITGGSSALDNSFHFDFDSNFSSEIFENKKMDKWLDDLFLTVNKPSCFVFVEQINQKIINQVQNLRNQGLLVFLIPTNLKDLFNEFSNRYVAHIVVYIDKENKTTQAYNKSLFEQIKDFKEYKLSSIKTIDFFNTEQVLDMFNNQLKYFVYNPFCIFKEMFFKDKK